MASDARLESATASAEHTPNIGPRERGKRVRFGIALAIVSAAAAVALMEGGAPRAWRLLLLLPLWASAVGFYQAREKT
jgi:hypothetical protein